jgi:hypothetical protein
MISQQAVGSITLVILTVLPVRGWAADQTAAELYGQGVHAYFAHDYDAAVAFLSESIAKNEADPRAYYFRGLALAAQHGLDAGLAYFARGAEVEVHRQDQRLYDVSNALQRIQGGLRAALEAQRKAVRQAAAARQKKENKLKYEELKRREDVVLFRPDQPVEKVEMEVPEIDLGVPDPFVTGAAFTGGQEVAVAVPREEKKSDDTMTLPAGKEEPRDPFGGPAKKTEDPFGDPNPFGDPKPAPEEPSAKTPSAKELPEDYNPFGEEVKSVAPDDPLFDASVRPELPPGMDVTGTIIDLVGKTLSKQGAEAGDRDPFGEPAPSAVPAEKPAPEDSKSKPASDAGATQEQPPADDPFAEGAAPKP